MISASLTSPLTRTPPARRRYSKRSPRNSPRRSRASRAPTRRTRISSRICCRRFTSRCGAASRRSVNDVRCELGSYRVAHNVAASARAAQSPAVRRITDLRVDGLADSQHGATPECRLTDFDNRLVRLQNADPAVDPGSSKPLDRQCEHLWHLERTSRRRDRPTSSASSLRRIRTPNDLHPAVAGRASRRRRKHMTICPVAKFWQAQALDADTRISRALRSSAVSDIRILRRWASAEA